MKLILLLVAAILLVKVPAVPSAKIDDMDGVDENKDEEFDDKKDEEMNFDDVMSDDAFDEEVLKGMLDVDDRKSLKDLSSEELASEVREMVSQIDRDGDGLLDQEEVMAYQIRLTEHNTKKLTGKVFEKNDDNSDGKVSFQEMWSESEGGVVEVSEMDAHQLSVKAKFDSADVDKDGSLDKEEFGLYVHPHRHDNMIEHLIKDQLMMYDKNEDGMISRKEYLKSFNPDDKPDDELPDWVEDEKANFDLVLDANQDGRLDSSEIRQWIVPDEDTMYRVETKHLFYNADANRDRKLSVEEIESKFDVFIDSSITNNGYAVHEEL